MKFISISILILIFNTQLLAQTPWTSGRSDGHAPIGVMGDHTHGKGDVMFSYRYMFMDMEGMRAGNSSLSTPEVLEDYMVTPINMPMHMHMLGAMYALSDQLTLMAMVNYTQQSMDHVTRMGGMFTTESSGFGDTWLSGLYKFYDNNRQRAHFNLDIRIPTGAIDKKDVTPASAPNASQLPYPMQLGTGTWDIKPGLTYLLEKDKTSMGVQANVDIPFTDNDHDYRWGTKTEILAWTAYQLNEMFSTSLRLTGIFQGEISGADEAFSMGVMNNMVPTIFTENTGGNWLFLGGGFNFYIPEGALHDVRVAVEYEYPLVQDLNGPQMETQQKLSLGLQYSF